MNCQENRYICLKILTSVIYLCPFAHLVYSIFSLLSAPSSTIFNGNKTYENLYTGLYVILAFLIYEPLCEECPVMIICLVSNYEDDHFTSIK